MGSAHARQQALAKQGSEAGRRSTGSVPSNIGGGTTGGPSLDATDNAAAASSGQLDRVPVVFTWTQGGQKVFLMTSTNGWSKQIPMVRSGNEFAVVQKLPKGVYQYKFNVDEQIRFAPDQPKTQDSKGEMNNVLDISNYNGFQIGMDDKEVAPKFGQHIPDPNDYTLDAPMIPMVLHKSAFCALPPRPPQVSGAQPLSIPLHSLCDHIYLQERVDENSPTMVAVTHRYGQKFSTTVYATRTLPIGAASTINSAGNPLKRILRSQRKPPT